MKTKIAVKSLEDVAKEQLSPFDGKPLTVMVSGGSILRVLEAEDIANMNKSQWVVYFADERMVPLTEKESNFKCAELFLQGVGTVYPMDTSLSEEQLLSDYKEKLQNAKFDLAFLGIGEDGHIASIFPESSSIDSSDIVTIITDSPKPPAKRITTTPRMLTMIKKLIFLVPRMANGLIKPVDEPHFSILSRLNTDMLIVTVDPLSK
ncbi:6-phosphogluconolactonase [Nematocida sp. LUAm3]|nr:6-phosphogluconolactonase [Nematocida sp. LUAm3]KAI5176378.1 6-phosphogluconolactonase [Nematocida sp. LUAm2]KAI5179038.1 6-phosphogluconolactonase [Nematocida sp. LUAm1]